MPFQKDQITKLILNKVQSSMKGILLLSKQAKSKLQPASESANSLIHSPILGRCKLCLRSHKFCLNCIKFDFPIPFAFAWICLDFACIFAVCMRCIDFAQILAQFVKKNEFMNSSTNPCAYIQNHSAALVLHKYAKQKFCAKFCRNSFA